MFGKLSDWFDHRTGYRKFRDAMLLEHIPGGAKWRYVWGSTLVFVFMIQLVTGVLLMTAYSPGDSTAWGSVYFIQYEMDFGWLIRGLHHFGSQTMVVLLGLHMLQVVIAGAHLPPREINWWLGLALLGVTLGLSLTGYLLPWDQKGYWATQVATNIMRDAPVIGPYLQRFLVGGPEYGNHTLTHFYTLHVGILPPTLIVLVIAHLAVFRRHGVTSPRNAQGEDMFWPAQAFRDLVVSLIIFGAMLALVIYAGHGNKIDGPEPDGMYEKAAKAGRAGLGANLDAPADPDTQGYPARPEWYFLFLFQLLKYFPGDSKFIATMVIPMGVGALLFLLPLFGYGRMRKFGHFIGVLVIVALLAGVGVLTCLAFADDEPQGFLNFPCNDVKKAEKFQEDLVKASKEAGRAVNLAHAGIPAEGARELLRKDPLLRGETLFKQNCAVCHNFSVAAPEGDFKGFHDADAKAPDLGGFGTEKWIRGLLENPKDKKYFGSTKLTGMINWRKRIEEERADWKVQDAPEVYKKKIAEQDADLDKVARFIAEQAKPKEKRDKTVLSEGVKSFSARKIHLRCQSCHTIGDDGGSQGPDLTDYGSQEWIRLMIMSPGHAKRYGDKNTMPAFRNLESPGAEVHEMLFREIDPKGVVVNMSDIDRELIIRWMTRDHRVIFGGNTISGAPKPKS
ncbi:MAG: cytochrome B6 [Planctomycetes bacterium]|nr:cytochrome B6 [Planctomycetota bacterium]